MDGHAPLLSGTDLNAYLATGIRTDHEATSAKEAREKLSKGMAILIREGSVSKDLDALAEIINADTANFLALCTDDRNPLDISEEGHLDELIRRLIAKGHVPHLIYRMASISAARIFGLKDRGIFRPRLARRYRNFGRFGKMPGHKCHQRRALGYARIVRDT